MLTCEVAHLGGPIEFTMEERFEFVAECHVEHVTAVGADEMVVVSSRDGFGQFEPSVVIAGDDSMDDRCVFEHREIAVGRALSQTRRFLEQTNDRERVGGLVQRLHQAAPILGVPLVRLPKTLQRRIVDFADSRTLRSRHGVRG